jgi:hypothetical protein
MKSVRQGFGHTLSLVITSTRADGVYMAPAFDNNQPLNGEKKEAKNILFLVLRVDLRVSIHFYNPDVNDNSHAKMRRQLT